MGTVAATAEFALILSEMDAPGDNECVAFMIASSTRRCCEELDTTEKDVCTWKLPGRRISGTM